MTKTRIYMTISLAWIISLLISLAPLIGLKSSRNLKEHCEANDNLIYALGSASMSYYIPLTVILFVYSRIFKAARRQAKFMKRNRFSVSSNDVANVQQPYNSSNSLKMKLRKFSNDCKCDELNGVFQGGDRVNTFSHLNKLDKENKTIKSNLAVNYVNNSIVTKLENTNMASTNLKKSRSFESSLFTLKIVNLRDNVDADKQQNRLLCKSCQNKEKKNVQSRSRLIRTSEMFFRFVNKFKLKSEHKATKTLGKPIKFIYLF
jgi:hypothetical protein